MVSYVLHVLSVFSPNFEKNVLYLRDLSMSVGVWILLFFFIDAQYFILFQPLDGYFVFPILFYYKVTSDIFVQATLWTQNGSVFHYKLEMLSDRACEFYILMDTSWLPLKVAVPIYLFSHSCRLVIYRDFKYLPTRFEIASFYCAFPLFCWVWASLHNLIKLFAYLNFYREISTRDMWPKSNRLV